MPIRLLKTLAMSALLTGGVACSSSGDVRPSAAPTTHSAQAVAPGTPAPATQAPSAAAARPAVGSPQTTAASPARPTPAQPRPTRPSTGRVPGATATKGSMNLSYSRTGGIAGFNDRVEVTGDSVTITRRGKAPVTRQLSPEEVSHLTALAEQAQKEPPPRVAPHRPVPDAFNISVAVGAQRVTLSSPPGELGDAWRALATGLQGLINPTR